MARQRRRRTRQVATEPVEEPVVQAEAPEEEAPEPEPEQPSEPVVDNEVDESNEAKGVSRRRSRTEENATLTAAEVFEQLGENKPVLLTRVGDDKFLVTAAPEIEKPVSDKKVQRSHRKKINNNVFWTDEYREWLEDWSKETYEGKLEYAEENDVEWEQNDNPGIDAMRISIAVCKAEGIEKFKEGYTKPSERDVAKDRLLAGEVLDGIDYP